MKYPTQKPIRIGTDYLPALLEVELTQKQRSDLFQVMLEYLFLGKTPEKPDPVTRAAWACIRWDLDYEKNAQGSR